MGMYTKLSVNIRFIENLPEEVIAALDIMSGNSNESSCVLPVHGLFKTFRWDFMLCCSSYYHIPFSLTKFHKDEISQRYYLSSSCDFKNYDGEIDLFFDFIAPYVEDGFLGYSQYEGAEHPTLHYVIDGKHIERCVDV